jgi:hypothetical protein
MQQFKTQNEINRWKRIARTDKAEREEKIKPGLKTPQSIPPNHQEHENNNLDIINLKN